MNGGKSGFTLIELIVVIVILGILSALAASKYIDLTDKANRAHDKAQLDACRTATTLLYASNALADSASARTTNSYGTFWPASTNAVYSNMTDTVQWFFVTNIVYNMTNGTWTVLPTW